MKPRWLVPLLVLTLLASLLPLTLAPAQAEVVTIDPPDELDLPEPLLPDDELDRLAQLQNLTVPLIGSEISPDDQAVFAIYANTQGSDPQVGFLNVQDGSFVPISLDASPVLPLTTFSWLDARTLVAVGINFEALFGPLPEEPAPVDPDAPAEEAPVEAAPPPVPSLFARLRIDRLTGEATVEPVAIPADTIPLSLSPDGKKVLLLTLPPEEAAEMGAGRLPQPFDVRVQVTPDQAQLTSRLPWSQLWQQADDGEMAVTSENVQLSYYHLETSERLHLTTFGENSGLLSIPSWSRDGKRIAFVRFNAEFGARGELSLGSTVTQDTLGLIPPTQNPFYQSNAVQTFDVRSGEVIFRELRATQGNGDVFVDARWSPDGETLLTRTGTPARLTGRPHPIYTYQFLERFSTRFYNAELQQTGSFDAPETAGPMQIIFASPGEVLFAGTFGLSQHIYYHNIATGEVRDLATRPGSYTLEGLFGVPLGIVATRESREVIFPFSSYDTPYDLYRIGWYGTEPTQLTTLNGESASANQVQVHELGFTLANGEQRSGWLIQPAGAAFPPQNERVVFWQQGGPTGSIFNQWSGFVENPFNILPNFGISVFVLPLPGRYGWGPAFNNGLADGTNFGQIDIDQSAEVARQMIDLGYAAPRGVGLVGCSYGGYFTSQSIARHPDLYAAAHTQCTLLDNITEWQTGFQALISYLIGETPATDAAEFAQDSPGYNALNVRTPTLIFHGTQDFLPVNIAETFHADIENTGTPVRMLKFEEEGHGLASPFNQFYGAQEQITWFRTYLSGAPGAPAAPPEAPAPEVVNVPAPAAVSAPVPPSAPQSQRPPSIREMVQGVRGR